MSRPLLIVGCGGFGREVLSVAAASGNGRNAIRVSGFVDDHPSEHNLSMISALGSRYLGVTSSLKAALLSDHDVVVAIADPSARQRIVGLLGARAHFGTVVHPDASIGKAVILAPGCIVAAGARLSTNIELGAHVQIDQNATIGHDSRVGCYSRLNPQACVSGAVQIGEKVTIGANAVVLQGLTIEDGSVVGAGAVVTRDVSAHATVKGVPAR